MKRLFPRCPSALAALWACCLFLCCIALVSAKPSAVAIYGPSATPAPNATQTPKPHDFPADCALSNQLDIVTQLCVTTNARANGYSALVTHDLDKWLASPIQVMVTGKGDKYTLQSRDQRGRVFKELHDVKVADVKAWTAADFASFLPPIQVATGPSVGVVPGQEDILVVAPFDFPITSSATPVWNGLLVDQLAHRGIRATATTDTADKIMSGGCQSGQKYLLYMATESHRDRSLVGFSRDDAFVRGFVYACDGSVASPAVWGTDSSKYLKSADKTSILGFSALLFPKFSWSAITPAAALGLSLLNVSDSPDVIANDSVERAMQHMVDRLCANTTVTCKFETITDCTGPRSDAIFGSSDPRRPPNCIPIPASPTPFPTATYKAR